MVGLQALALALAAGTIPPDPVLFRLPGLSPLLQSLYGAARFASVRTLPWDAATPERPLAAAAGFSRCIDLRDFAFDPAFRGVAMIDYFLARLGMTPSQVPAAAKRNAWLAAAVRPCPPRDVRPGYVLVCPRASMPLRDMPPTIEAAIGTWLRADASRPIMIQQHADSLAALCGQVAAAALVVSTDTAPVHLADAYSVPCLAFFPTHDPAWRVRDYPFCRPVHLPAAGLEPALEFSRGPSDLAAARAAWFPHGEDLTWLFDALRGALDAVEGSA